MLKLTSKPSNDPPGSMSRREFLQAGALGTAGLTLAGLEALRASGRVKARGERSAILIFNLGGPSHLDTWDLKPEAPREIRGPFRPLRTRSPEIQISELFPLQARLAGRFSLVRTVHHDAPAVHDTGHQLLQTGRLAAPGVRFPHAGCAVAYLRGRREGHVLLPEPMGNTGGALPHGQDGGFLGPAFDPALPPGAAGRGAVAAGAPPPEIAEVELERGRPVREAVEAALERFEAAGGPARGDRAFQAAYRVVTSREAREALDLSREREGVRLRYGTGRFGRCCLMARRLVEAGVPFVTVNTFTTVFDEPTWDIHGSRPFSSMADLRDTVAPMYDRGYSALLEDLEERGLLETTLVAGLAEFGRTPRINAAGGRDHWPECWTVSFAGGGVQGGRVVGRSDAIGAYPAERPVSPQEVVATIYHSLGVDLRQTLPGPQSTPVPLVDPGCEPILELF